MNLTHPKRVNHHQKAFWKRLQNYTTQSHTQPLNERENHATNPAIHKINKN